MLAYHEAGAGSAVVLLHGFPLSRAIWDQQVAHLKQEHRVIAPDLPGMGLSTKCAGEEPVTMQRMAEEVVALLDHLKVDRFAVAGLGLVATQAGADSPEAREGRIALAERVRKEGEITCPTLIIAGQDDKIIPIEKAEVMAANLKSVVLTKVPGGHLPMLEQPAAVNEALERWVGFSF